MIKRNKIALTVSSIVTLLPTLLGILRHSLLPERLLLSANLFIIFPVILLAIHWLCVLLTVKLDQGREQNPKMLTVIFSIIPVLSLSCCGVFIMTAFGYAKYIYAGLLLILALFFILIGNYMPKTTKNRTVGIKIKWTLANEENWNATHRFAGKLYVAIGFLCLLAMPLPSTAFPFVALAMIPALMIPILYSYRFYKQQLADGRATKESYEQALAETFKNPKRARRFGIGGTVLLVVAITVVMFTGKIEATAGDDALTVKATYWKNASISYSEIDAIEYRESGIDGARISGYGSARLMLGLFQNEELGSYTRYTYAKELPCIILTVDGQYTVIGLESADATQALYDQLSEQVSK